MSEPITLCIVLGLSPRTTVLAYRLRRLLASSVKGVYLGYRIVRRSGITVLGTASTYQLSLRPTGAGFFAASGFSVYRLVRRHRATVDTAAAGAGVSLPPRTPPSVCRFGRQRGTAISNAKPGLRLRRRPHPTICVAGWVPPFRSPASELSPGMSSWALASACRFGCWLQLVMSGAGHG